jgi:hypothetical protein
MKPETRPLDRVNPRAGFDNYAEKNLGACLGGSIHLPQYKEA